MTEHEFLDLFVSQRALFARHFPRAAQTKVEFIDRPCTIDGLCGFRDLAYATPALNVITFQRRFLAFPIENMVGLMRHELGHVVDPVFPDPGAEQRADNIAEFVTGQRIQYDPNFVQTVGAGSYPRPPHLHQ